MRSVCDFTYQFIVRQIVQKMVKFHASRNRHSFIEV